MEMGCLKLCSWEYGRSPNRWRSELWVGLRSSKNTQGGCRPELVFESWVQRELPPLLPDALPADSFFNTLIHRFEDSRLPNICADRGEDPLFRLCETNPLFFSSLRLSNPELCAHYEAIILNKALAPSSFSPHKAPLWV